MIEQCFAANPGRHDQHTTPAGKPPRHALLRGARAGHTWLWVAVVLCGPPSAMAQQPRNIVLSDAQFKESYLEKVTVSGGVRAGFMQRSTLPHVDLQALSIHLQRPVDEEDAMLCVNMVSRDGRYTASWQYALGKQPPGPIAVNMPSKYQEQLAAYTPDALAVLAGIARKDCLSPEMRYVPASWGADTADDYVLYVNSSNTDTEIGIPGAKERIPCTRIAADNAIAYDTQCVLKRELLLEPKSIYLLRKNFGNRLPNVEFPVR
ncbi:hypothetical protein Despr_0017 [Desulfobulbus propionicus DSM 2032]|uniref:Uncharacterized protein n=1 Tax=Desulfobulbus propionicus (strain ATCC 33891 / DSM 2032 / VKM B-1956 / 1pr3) TaxID=577650 RepID=A0A7U4DMQ3_DESPD|nr:hypothetical protein [Desulfobulbus propionicus]ADW16211.1 hypothetical protein Despr_0017 [Desulfobulbus propionicus DSM 2032]